MVKNFTIIKSTIVLNFSNFFNFANFKKIRRLSSLRIFVKKSSLIQP